MPVAAPVSYIKCLCLTEEAGCTRSVFLRGVAWSVARNLTSCTATSTSFKRCMLCSCFICEKQEQTTFHV